jgi:DNA sulfur modification protein DndD
MIIRQLRLRNFGTYSGDSVFDFSPIQEGLDYRPITVVRGKNGVGKSTVMQAIRLCLHGPLSVGPRVAKAEYEDYLSSRIHRNVTDEFQPDEARVELLLDFVSLGKKSSFHISRSWQRSGRKIAETLIVLEDGKPIQRVSAQQRESFLRELVSPSAADVFFFDSERLHLLADDATSSRLFSETTRTLLGLDIVSRLQRDLNLYLSRQDAGQGGTTLQIQLETVIRDIEDKSREIAELEIVQRSESEHIAALQLAIAQHEQIIAGEGNAFAENRNALHAVEQNQLTEIERQRVSIQDLCSGLVPFAVAPEFCKRVAQRLIAEERLQRTAAARDLFKEQLSQLARDFKPDKFWRELGLQADKQRRAKLLKRVEESLERALPSAKQGAEEIILHASEQTRHTLLEWLAQATDEAPRRFCGAVRELRTLETDLKKVREELSGMPEEAALMPMLTRLGELHRQLGALQQEQKARTERLRQLENAKQQLEWQQRSVLLKITDSKSENRRIQLAAKTQLALEEYAELLLQRKIEAVQASIAEHFNALSHKGDFLESVAIDPRTFEMRLFRGGRPFDRSELSAGEKQLLATSALWALREASSLPIPVIVDTPVGRLDSNHRLSMLEDYFPHVSHQVILLATDAELDNDALAVLAPHVARRYELCYDSETGSTLLATMPGERGVVPTAPVGNQ